MGALGYRKRTGFHAGLTVAQISEFSLIFMAMGVTLGHVGAEALGLVTLVGLITISLSTYMITYSHRLYDRLEFLLAPFERSGTPREADEHPAAAGYDVLLFGLGRIAVTSHREESGRKLDAAGADLVLEPFQDAADQAADLLAGQRHPPRFEVIEPEDQKELAP